MMGETQRKGQDQKISGHSQKTQVECCDICGDIGFSNALLYCSECPDTAAHQYCLGIPPGSIDDSFNWVCEYCCASTEPQPSTSSISGASTDRSEEHCWEHAGAVKEIVFEMKDFSSLFPKSFMRKRRTKMLKRKRVPSTLKLDIELIFGASKRIRRGKPDAKSLSNNEVVQASTMTRQSGNIKVTGHLDNILIIEEEEKKQLEYVTVEQPVTVETATDQDKMEIVLVDDQPEPLLMLRPVEFLGKSEQVETNYGSQIFESSSRIVASSISQFLDCREESVASVSSFMECPKEIMSGVVLLVSPSGETIIGECMGFCDDDPQSSSLPRFVLDYWEESESPVSSFMECPKELMSGVILLVSPSGEAIIRECMGLCEDSQLTSILSLTSSSDWISLDSLVQQVGRVKPDSTSGLQKTVDNYRYVARSCDIEETVMLDDLGLEIGEEVYAHHPEECIENFHDRMIDACEDNMEEKVRQVNEASKADVINEPVPVEDQPFPIQILKGTLKQIQTCSESQDSTHPLECNDTCNPSYNRLQKSEGLDSSSPRSATICGTRDTNGPSKFSIPLSILKMGDEYHQASSDTVITQVGKYKIRSDLAPVLRNVLDSYGDIFRDCQIEPEPVIVDFCMVIQDLQTVPFKCLKHHHVDSLRNAVNLFEALGVDVKWLSNHCECLEEIACEISRYPGLKQELAQNIKSVESQERILRLKRGSASQQQEEIVQLERELKSSKEHTEKLRCVVENIRALCRRFLGKSLADGLF